MTDEIKQRLERMKDVLEEVEGKHTPSRVVYCTKCDEYGVGRENELECGIIGPESTDLHLDHHIVEDRVETTMSGYVMALQWALNRQKESETDMNGETQEYLTDYSDGS